MVSDKRIQRVPYLDGVMLKDVALTAGINNEIEHGLGRPFEGIDVTINSSNCTVWQDQGANKTPSTVIHIQCSSNTTVNLWIY